MIGIDVVYVPQFEKVVEGYPGHSLRDRIFTKQELRSLDNMAIQESLIEALAGFFAAKEAVIKASDGDLNIGDLQRIEIAADKDGGMSATVVNGDTVKSIFKVSITHDRDYVIAIAFAQIAQS